VKKVRVSVEGAAVKTTEFEYKDEPRSTKVIPSDAPHVVYDLGDDGSVLKWWNVKKPPELDLGGALYDNREIDGFFWEGTRLLEARAESAEGIASIKVIANGNTLVDEQTCPKPQVIECLIEKSEWVTESDLHAPGHLQLEVIATDRIGESTSERFWVDVPKPMPLAPGTPVQPRFRDIAKFREDYGLEVVFPVANETELNERILDLIKAWNEPNTPAGQVARSSMERWGVPLRPADVAELEYRLAYWQEAVSKIPAWAEANASGSFAGYYLDDRAGGLMRTGFTSDQLGNISSLKGGVNLPAEDRIAPFTVQPNNSLASLRDLADQVSSLGLSNPAAKIYRVGVENDLVRVGSKAVGAATSLLHSQFGAGVPISVYENGPLRAMAGRERITGKMLGGERIQIKEPNEEEADCTNSFGAFEYATKPADGSEVLRLFALTAAHCGELSSSVIRRRVPPPNKPEDRVRAGFVRRHGYEQHQTSIRPLDIAAVKLEGQIEPRRVYTSSYEAPLAVRGWSVVGPGTRLCHSGATTNEVKCGVINMQEPEDYIQCEFINEGTGECEGPLIPLNQWCFDAPIRSGDSGGPVWIEGTNTAVGINSSGGSTRTCMAAIAVDERFPGMASVFSDPSMGPLGGLTTVF
jgi:Trypsin